MTSYAYDRLTVLDCSLLFEALRERTEQAREAQTDETAPLHAAAERRQSRWRDAVSAARQAAEAGGLTEEARGSNGTRSRETPATH